MSILVRHAWVNFYLAWVGLCKAWVNLTEALVDMSARRGGNLDLGVGMFQLKQ